MAGALQPTELTKEWTGAIRDIAHKKSNRSIAGKSQGRPLLLLLFIPQCTELRRSEASQVYGD